MIYVVIIISANAVSIPANVSALISATNAISANAPTINKLSKSSIINFEFYFIISLDAYFIELDIFFY